MDRHATVKIGEYTVPLIGVPADATQQECSMCKKSFHLSDIILDENGQPCCKLCLSPNAPAHRAPDTNAMNPKETLAGASVQPVVSTSGLLRPKTNLKIVLAT